MLFRLKALGSLVIEGPDGALSGSAAQRRPLALLVLLAAARDRGVSREKLIGLLWSDTTDERARHAFAQTLYRLRQEYGTEAIEGADVLRLQPGALDVDFTAYEDALRRGELEAAVGLYGGPFLDGFFLPGAPEFERWLEHERARLSGLHRQLLERLATSAAVSGAHDRAVEWWRALAAADPMNSHVAACLVEALTLAGDRAGALRYARVHEAMIKQELDSKPSAEFLAAVAAVRARKVERAKASAADVPAADVPAANVPSDELALQVGAETASSKTGSVFGHTSETLRVAVPRRAVRRGLAIAGALLVATGAIAYARLDSSGGAHRPVIAVGYIADYTGGDTAAVARILPELLTTNLSRLDGIAVVNRTRLHELLAPRGGRQAEGSEFARAAQEAGAEQLLDGALYRRGDGMLRLDLRVLDMTSGHVRRVYQAEARDAFALADSATARIAAEFGAPLSATLRVSDVTTTSLVAFRLYEEGLRALLQLDRSGARRLFGAALAADSGFAMAAFWLFRATHDHEHLRRALRLADRATDRERLIIRANWAVAVNHPSQVAVAETLAARYPADPEGQLLLANALHWHGDFAGALVASRQAFAMDSLSLRTNAPRCLACEALSITFSAYTFMDSMALAEAVAREWLVRQPSSPIAWGALRQILAARDDSAGALAANERFRATTSGSFNDWEWLASLSVRTGNFAKADRMLNQLIESGTPGEVGRALWYLAISQRHRGLLSEALATTRRLTRVPHDVSAFLHHGQVLREMGRPLEAVAVFDSAATRVRAMHAEPSSRARHETWALTHKAAALAAGGELATLSALADSIQSLGARSSYGRDHRLHHHVRGLLFAARGQKQEAVAAFRNAIWSPVAGYTRTNFELGRLLIELGRPSEAIPVLRAALHGGLEATNLYVTHTEVRALLSRAYAATNRNDSAIVHRKWVEAAMTGSDSNARLHIDGLLGDLPVAGTSP